MVLCDVKMYHIRLKVSRGPTEAEFREKKKKGRRPTGTEIKKYESGYRTVSNLFPVVRHFNIPNHIQPAVSRIILLLLLLCIVFQGSVASQIEPL